MFKPNFRYTHKIVRLLARISAAREVILNSPLIPKWEVALRREAIIHSAHSSTSIEGNRLSFEQVSELAQGREVMATRKDKKEVLNYLGVLEKIGELVKEDSINEKDILNIHRILTKGTLDNPLDCGVYRNRYVVVANRLTGEVFFRPPQNEEVPGLIKNLVEWISSDETKELDPIIEAGIVHYEFVRIHPFVDGNGRTARVLATLILYKRDFDTKQFFCLDDYYDSDRQVYYRALQSVDQKTFDLTNWLEYFVEGVNVSIETVKERVIKLSSERLRKTKTGQIALTERQMQIVEYINLHGKIMNKNIRDMFKISPQAAHKEIKKLLKLGVVKSVGKGRGLYYELA
ncbi:MAG: Fic family protein [candidate division WOR-3 bacterium]|nr:Fic family protein [candidate division WOR-3 bacterium]